MLVGHGTCLEGLAVREILLLEGVRSAEEDRQHGGSCVGVLNQAGSLPSAWVKEWWLPFVRGAC